MKLTIYLLAGAAGGLLTFVGIYVLVYIATLMASLLPEAWRVAGALGLIFAFPGAFVGGMLYWRAQC